MSSSSRLIRQLFLSVVDPNQETISATELVNRINRDRSDWLARPEYQLLLQQTGLHQLARSFCQRYRMPIDNESSESDSDPSSENEWNDSSGIIDDQYLLRFSDLESWEKAAALKFGKPSAYLPSLNAHKEVCRMTPDERIEAGNAGIKLGQETVDKFRILKRWGLRGGGTDYSNSSI